MTESPDSETLLIFPTTFPIKMLGRDNDAFRDTARQLIEQFTGALDDSALQSSLSRNGTFVSLTFTIMATSQQQLDDIYRAASAHQDVLMAL